MNITISIASIIIAFAALWVSVKAYKRDTPNLKVNIDNQKINCFFGDVETEHEQQFGYGRIAGIRFRIINSSPVSIEIHSIVLKIKSEKYKLIDTDNAYWENVYFLSYDEEDKKVPDINYGIYYAVEGIKLPSIIEPYTTLPCVTLFYHFPKAITKKVKAKLIINTAIGEIKKRIELYEYNDTFSKDEFKDVQQFYKSM